MSSFLFHTLLVVALTFQYGYSRVIKIDEIPGGHFILKPRALHIRNNFQGNVEIAEDQYWSLELKITAASAEVQQDVQFYCGVDSSDAILDIQVYRETPQSSPEISSMDKVTVDITLRGPGHLVLPGSKIFYSTNSTGRTILHSWGGYKEAIEEYELPPVNKLVEISHPCYEACPRACDVLKQACLSCKRGFVYDSKKSTWDTVECKDINECDIGKQSCPMHTVCENTAGGYNCICADGYHRKGAICEACKPCPSGWYELFPCNATHEAVCKKCSPPCERYLYEVHPCGIGYDRHCEDILRGFKPIDASSVLKPIKVHRGSKLVPFTGHEKFVITDDRLLTTTSEAKVNLSIIEDKKLTIWRSDSLKIDLRISHVDVLPLFMDTEALTSFDKQFFSGHDGLHAVKSHCRHPIPDEYILKHKIIKNFRTVVKKEKCTRKQEHICRDEADFGQEYTRRVAQPCNAQATGRFHDANLYCSMYSNLTSIFGISKDSFNDGLTWHFQEKSCQYLYMACKTCRKDKCTGKKANTACFKQCDFICQSYRRSQCRKMAPACVDGDMSEWILNADFKGWDLSARFNCFLERQYPETPFVISYRVKVANTSLLSKWIRVNEKRVFKNANEYSLGDFEVKFEKGDRLTENVLVTGKRSPKGASSGYNFQVYNLRTMDQLNFNEEIEEIRFVPAKLFPSAIGDWSDEENCKVLSQWKKYLAKAEPLAENVRVETAAKFGRRNAYRLRQNQDGPTVKISLPRSKSLLNQFGKKSQITMLNSTLRANSSHWILHLRANVTSCPAYFEVTIMEKTEMALVLKQDILVLCPSIYFHVIALLPKDSAQNMHKAKLFLAYVVNGNIVHETRVEKSLELEVDDRFTIRRKESKLTKKHFDIGMLSKFDPIILLTGFFILGLIAIVIFSCLVRPSKATKARKMGDRLAAMRVGDIGYVRQQLDKEDNLQIRQVVPIVFLVAARVAYSFLLTASFIILIFTIVNKEELDAVQDFKEFVELKVNQSNKIALALDLFRESEAKIITDRAAFMECACDYHMGRIMRNVRDKMTSIIQLHDIILFDKISEAIMRKVRTRLAFLNVIYHKFHHYRSRIINGLYKIENQVLRYAYKVYGNKWFSAARGMFGAWQDRKGIDFLGNLGAFNAFEFRRLKRRIYEAIHSLDSLLDLKSVIERLKRPFYPLANALLAPIRNMKHRVKEAVKDRIKRIRDRILRNIPCIGDIDMRKWGRSDDFDYDEKMKKICRLQEANKFMEKIIDEAKSAKNSSDQFVINSVRDDAAFNILDGDAVEEEHDKREKSRLEALKKVAGYYKPSEDAMVAFALLKKYSVILVLIFDALLISYRSLKTYRFAFMMASGFEMTKEHKRVGDEFGRGDAKKKKASARKIVDCIAKSILRFFTTITFILKLIFTTLVIPILFVIVCVGAFFYLAFAFTYNGMNVDTLDKLGVFKLLSSRLDMNFNITSQSLKEQAAYLNKFDIGMYKESLRVQTEEFRNTINEFNMDEVIRLDRLRAELCDVDSDGCHFDFRRLMERLDMKVKPCVFPVIKARMPDNVYNSEAYRRQLKYELKHYVDAFRLIIIRTFYIILGVIGTIIFTVIMSKVLFNFLKKMGMIRIKQKHIYHELPVSLRRKYKENLQ